MKLFCAYAFTGEDLDVITARMRVVVDVLEAQGHEVYCNRFDESLDELQSKGDVKGIFKEAFRQIKNCEALVAVVASPNRSVGQIMEIGTALSHGKPVYLIEHVSAKNSSYLSQLVDRVYSWDNQESLVAALKNI